jgi:hypothetical protein
MVERAVGARLAPTVVGSPEPHRNRRLVENE